MVENISSFETWWRKLLLKVEASFKKKNCIWNLTTRRLRTCVLPDLAITYKNLEKNVYSNQDNNLLTNKILTWSGSWQLMARSGVWIWYNITMKLYPTTLLKMVDQCHAFWSVQGYHSSSWEKFPDFLQKFSWIF